MVLKAINDTTNFADTLDLATMAYDQTVNEVQYLHRDLMIAANNTKDCQNGQNVVANAKAAREALQVSMRLSECDHISGRANDCRIVPSTYKLC